MIVKEGELWVVRAESGRKMGSYKTKAEAEKRLQQAEMFKHMRANWAKGIGKPRGKSKAKGKGQAAKGKGT
jgi:hypothetical protein